MRNWPPKRPPRYRSWILGLRFPLFVEPIRDLIRWNDLKIGIPFEGGPEGFREDGTDLVLPELAEEVFLTGHGLGRVHRIAQDGHTDPGKHTRDGSYYRIIKLTDALVIALGVLFRFGPGVHYLFFFLANVLTRVGLPPTPWGFARFLLTADRF